MIFGMSNLLKLDGIQLDQALPYRNEVNHERCSD